MRLNRGRKTILALEGWADAIFTPHINPFYYLGAITIFFFYLLIASGIYLFIFYEIAAPYESVKYITEGQWHIGGIMRSIHRYAADGMVIVAILHLLHTYLTDRYRLWRWVAWTSGIVLLAAVWVTGIVGYWMVWDQRSQMIAELTAGFLDYIPIFGNSLSMSFASQGLITGLFFFVALFIHVMVPVLLFIILWIHVVRISKPVINPPKILAIIILCVIIGLSVIKPATSLVKANTDKLISSIGIDWFYLLFYPLFNAAPPWLAWIIVAGSVLALALAPWFVKSKKLAPAEIIREKCTGCSQCFEDCPYEAIHIMPRTDGRPYDLEAVVIPKRCASCGICVGSCNFNAVNFPEKTEKIILSEITNMIAEAKQKHETVLLGIVCSYSVDLSKIIEPAAKAINNMPNVNPRTKDFGVGVKLMTLPCAGMITPSWIEHALNAGADGVFICTCPTGDCHFRLGSKWLEERLAGERLPVLKQHVDRSLIRVFKYSALGAEDLLEDIKAFEQAIKTKSNAQYAPEKPFIKKKHIAFSSIALSIPAALVLYFSDLHYPFSNPADSLLKISVKHTGKRIVECDESAIVAKEAQKYGEMLKETGRAQMNLTALGKCSRERHPVYVELYLDNEKRLAKSYKPSGWQRDGSSFVYEKFLLKPEQHTLVIRMRDEKESGQFNYTFEGGIETKAGYITIVDFDEREKKFFVR